MSQASSRPIFSRINLLLAVAIIILAIITAWIHLELAIMLGFFTGHALAGRGSTHSGLAGLIFSHLALLFFLNGIGYIILAIALYLPQPRNMQRIIRWILIIFTAVTVIAYFALIGLHQNPTGYVDKIVEIVLIALLLIEDRRAITLSKPNIIA